MKMIILPFQICFMIELVLIATYIFPLIARFEMKFLELFKTAFFMANKHFLTSITLLVMGAAIIVASLYYMLLFAVAIGLYVFGASFFLMKVFKKYRPEIDKDELIGEAIE